MEKQLEILLTTRGHIKSLIDGLSDEILTKLPEGMSNNIIWNAGHILVSHQGLTYGLAGKVGLFDTDFVSKFKKGSSVESDLSEFIPLIKENMVSEAEQFVADFKSGVFTEFRNYTTSYKVELNTLEDAINFINTHEGVHYGYMLAQRKILMGS